MNSPATTCPFEIRLSVGGDLTVQAVLINVSASAQKFLANSWHQYPVLHLEIGATVLTGSSSRANVRPPQQSLAVRPESYAAIAPGQTIVLGSGRFAKIGGGYDLSWGTQKFQSLRPGSYGIYAVEEFYGFIDTGPDGEEGVMPGVWRGTVRSNKWQCPLF